MSSRDKPDLELEPQALSANVFALPSDPLLDRQFNLNNTGQPGGTPDIDINVFPVWEDYRGEGVTVGIIDDGVEHTHPDLIDNYNADIDHDSRGNDSDAMAEGSDAHGTAVAGVIAADDNGFGSVGVAPDAEIAGFRMGFGASGTLGQITANLQRQVGVDISNNSWGFGGHFGDNFKSGTFRAHANAIEDAVADGRDGLGTVWVFAAGNSRTSGDNVNYHSFQNSRQTIAVAAAEDDGDITFYSTPGAAVLTTAPVAAGGGLGGVITTDRQGSAGYSASFEGGDYTTGFNGTSAATPMVSGVIALMLDANADLGYRDVQEILAYSSRQIDASDAGWAVNDAGDWNGGGLHVSHDFGFGLVDAHAAVRLAESWEKQSVLANEHSISAFRAPNLFIRDNATVSDSITITEQIDLQWVEIDVNIDHSWIGDLVIDLIGPDGTVSTLVDQPGKTAGNAWGSSQQDINFVLTSAHHWGEETSGEWTLRISDHYAVDSGRLINWSLTLFGDVIADDDDYIYSDEYGVFAAADAGRRTLSDTGGDDRINAAALTAAALIDLNAGAAGQIAGQAFSISQGTIIEDVFGGDGDDTLIGNDAGNDINGARGDDELIGGAGDDSITGGRGADRIIYKAGDGSDVLTDFDALADLLILDGVGGVFDFDSFIAAGRQNGADFVVGFEDGQSLTFSALDGSALTTVNLELVNADAPDVAPEPVGPQLLVGSDGIDNVNGTEFEDTIEGRGGDDLLYGGDGADSIDGGTGHDIADGGSGDDIITGDDGNDGIKGAGGADSLFGGLDDDTIMGMQDSDYLRGDAGDDRVAGGDGDDRVIGGDGADVLTGDDGDDDVDGGFGRDRVYGGNGNDNLSGGEDDDLLFGGDGADLLAGDGGADRLNGGIGDDRINGNAGVDLINGDAGDDTLIGGTESDSLYGGDGLDTILAEEGDDQVAGGDDADRLDGGAGHDLIYGDGGSDFLTGDAGEDTLRGGDGDDLIFGGADADIVLGNAGADRLSGGDASDRLDGGAGNDLIYGDGDADVLTGGVGSDTVRGGDGADSLYGGEDADTVFGDAGDDKVIGDGGDDRLDGGDGDDFIHGNDGSDRITGGNGNDNLRGDAGVDALFGGTGADTIQGGADGDRLEGGADDDRLAGDGGDDLVLGDGGVDVITGDAGDDALFGGADDDRIYGGDGNDRIAGGQGNDRLEGNAGADRFEFSDADGAGADVIIDFAQGEDQLALDLLNASEVSNLDIDGDGDADTRITFDNGATLDLLGVSIGTVDELL